MSVTSGDVRFDPTPTPTASKMLSVTQALNPQRTGAESAKARRLQRLKEVRAAETAAAKAQRARYDLRKKRARAAQLNEEQLR